MAEARAGPPPPPPPTARGDPGAARRRARWVAIGLGTAATGAGAGALVRGMRSWIDLDRSVAVFLTAGVVFFVMWLWLPALLRDGPPKRLARRMLSAGVATALMLATLWLLWSTWS